MNLMADNPNNNIHIQQYLDRTLRINNQSFTKPLIIRLNSIIPDISSASPKNITQKDIELIQSFGKFIFIITTGPSHQWLDHTTLQTIKEYQLFPEVMSSEAACRTFNVLASENRPITCLFFP